MNRHLVVQKEKGPHRLLVEGQDDKYTVINLLSRHGTDWDAPGMPFVQDLEGVDNVLPSLATAVLAYERLGIVVDMDDPGHKDQKDRWLKVRDRLRSKGIAVPDAPAREGTIMPGLRGASSRVGVWIMPDNESPGVLEHFVSTLVPAGDRCFAHANEATSRARAIGAPLAEKDHQKGVIRAWLAWQANPGVPFGVALKMKYLRDDSEEALRFVAWFKKLFLEPAEIPGVEQAQG